MVPRWRRVGEWWGQLWVAKRRRLGPFFASCVFSLLGLRSWCANYDGVEDAGRRFYSLEGYGLVELIAVI